MTDLETQRPARISFASNRFVRISLFGLLVTIGLLTPPIDSITDQNLTLHMFQHIGIFVASAIFGYGLERYIVTHLVLLKNRSTLLGNFVIEVIKFNVKTKGLILGAVIPGFILAFWHFPSNFDLAAVNESVHIIEHFTYIIAGSIVGLSISAIPRRFKIGLLFFAFMQAGMMGSMMLVWPSFYSAYTASANLTMDTSIMLFGGVGVLSTGALLLKEMDVI